LFFSWWTNREQDRFQRAIEERQSAPLLVPGIEPDQRGKEITLYPEIGEPFRKVADRLVIDEKYGGTRIVIPMWNAGLGVAILMGSVSVMPDCTKSLAGMASPGHLLGRKDVGYYVVPSGESEQLKYFQPRFTSLGKQYRKAADAMTVNMLVRYTDLLRRRLRWTCVTYTRADTHSDWSLAQSSYGARE
jgi:hypothetical protein